MADDTKNLAALLNGIAKRNYYGETDISEEFLKTELFPDIADDEFKTILLKCTNVMKSMVSADMDLNQTEAFLTSQVKKKEGGLTENLANAFRKFWKSNKNKIHESVIAQTSWNNTLKQMSWRIDIQSQTRHIDQINTPTAFVELHIGPNEKKSEIVGEVLKQLTEEKFIVKATNGPRYVVGCRRQLDKAKLKSGTRVALDMTTLTIMRHLPREVDPLVYNMSTEDPGDVSYNQIGGLGEQIRELREGLVGLHHMM